MMKKAVLAVAIMLAGSLQALGISDTTVEIVYSGTKATVTVASNIKSYVTVNSGTSAHVKLTQSSSFNPSAFVTTDNTSGEITYILSGSSADGEFYLTAPSKATVQVEDLTLTNSTPTHSGAAISIYGGKRYKLSAKNETTSTLKDAATGEQGGCIYVKGHLELQGKGTLNVYGNLKHAIKSTEYMAAKNLTLNIPYAVKDGMHCDEYFLMEGGKLTLSNIGDDGIQIDIDTNDAKTGETTDHEAENSGNFYQTDGTLTISSVAQLSATGTAINAEGTEQHTGGTYNNLTGITPAVAGRADAGGAAYDMSGRRIAQGQKHKGIHIWNNRKVIVR